jgi:hypothetical protein
MAPGPGPQVFVGQRHRPAWQIGTEVPLYRSPPNHRDRIS